MEIKITVSTNRVGSDDYAIIEISDDDISGMSNEEFENYIGEIAVDEMLNNGLVNWNWSIIK